MDPRWILRTAFLVASIVACSTPPPSPEGPEAACFETDAWRIAGDLSVRSEREGGDTLLLKLTPDMHEIEESEKLFGPGTASGSLKIVYLCRPGGHDLEITDQSAWDRAEGAIGNCSEQDIFLPTFPFRIDHKTALRFMDRPVPLAGKGVVALGLSPKKDVVAVLSSEIPPSPGFFFSEAGSGRHYHQLFRMHDGTPIGESTQVPLDAGNRQVNACWSADGRHVIYFDISHMRLCVIRPSAVLEGSSSF